ncbi:MAG TPA: uroporphyrinogen-III synthase [Candidatus Paceibacterota bacterium]|nr:uroporphyrinogen-III synthase [Candidatus Paceibacterota bacterium]
MHKKRIILTGAARESRLLGKRIKDSGIEVEIVPTIRIQRRPLDEVSKKRIGNADSYDYLIFTSAHAVHYFADYLREWRIKIPKNPKTIAVGPATSRAAAEIGLVPRIVSKTPGARSLTKALAHVHGKRILFHRSAIAASSPVETLQKNGAVVDMVELYTTTTRSPSAPRLKELLAKEVHAIVFLSPSSIASFSKHLEGAILRKRAFAMPVIAIGPTTARAASDAGFRTISIAHPSTTDGVIELLRKLY